MVKIVGGGGEIGVRSRDFCEFIHSCRNYLENNIV